MSKRPGYGKYTKNALLKETKGKCKYCTNFFEPFDYQVDHITPYSKKGEDNARNYIIVCGACNRRKQNKTLEEYCGYLMVRGELTKKLFNLLLWFDKNVQGRDRKLDRLFWLDMKNNYQILTIKECKKQWQ